MVYLFLANGFEEVEALLPLDILRRGGVDVTLVSVGGGETVVGSHGIRVGADLPDTMFRDSSPEAVILPGGMPGATNLANSKVVENALRVTDKNGGLLCAICAAPMVLGKYGYVKGKEAVCFPGFENSLTGAKISTKRVVRDDRVITAAGMGVAAEFGYEILSALRGPEISAKIRRNVLGD